MFNARALHKEQNKAFCVVGVVKQIEIGDCKVKSLKTGMLKPIIKQIFNWVGYYV